MLAEFSFGPEYSCWYWDRLGIKPAESKLGLFQMIPYGQITLVVEMVEQLCLLYNNFRHFLKKAEDLIPHDMAALCVHVGFG